MNEPCVLCFLCQGKCTPCVCHFCKQVWCDKYTKEESFESFKYPACPECIFVFEVYIEMKKIYGDKIKMVLTSRGIAFFVPLGLEFSGVVLLTDEERDNKKSKEEHNEKKKVTHTLKNK